MKLNKKQHFIYDLWISSLAVLAVVLIIIDLSDGIDGWKLILYRGIIFMFYVDYAVRLYSAPNKTKYMKDNIADIVVLLPLRTVFGGLPFLQSHHMYRLLGLPRLLSILYRPLKKARRFFNTNGFKYMVFITVMMVLTGGVLIHFAEDMSVSDGIWWAFVTATTVGYGDISPSTFYGRIIAMVLMLVGIGLIGSLTSTLTSYFMRSTKKDKKNLTIAMIQDQLDQFDELSEKEVDDLCLILKTLKSKQS